MKKEIEHNIIYFSDNYEEFTIEELIKKIDEIKIIDPIISSLKIRPCIDDDNESRFALISYRLETDNEYNMRIRYEYNKIKESKRNKEFILKLKNQQEYETFLRLKEKFS